jgi:predicted helicase
MNRRLNDAVGRIPQFFPTAKHENIVIAVTGAGSQMEFSCLVSNVIPDLEHISKSQCFPLYFYDHIDKLDDADSKIAKKFADKDGYIRRSAISAGGVKQFQSIYNDRKILDEDIFYYVYGVLHSPTYRERFQNDLKKMLPRIPNLKDFWGFSKAGRELAKWHLNYESVKPFKLTEEIAGTLKDKKALYRVAEMKHPKAGKVPDKTTIIYNSNVKISGIPQDAYNYIVNGKTALDWIMERYAVTINKDSGIKNDPNDWSADPRYIIDLVGRVVEVSLQTNRIVKNLPAFEVLAEKAIDGRNLIQPAA